MVQAAAVCMEGKALNWYRWCQRMYPIKTWPDFRDGLIERFQGVKDEHERLFSLMQTSSVSEYRDKFEEISAGLEGIPEEALLGAFLKGLKDSVKAGVRPFQPATLYEAMTMAQLVEENQEATRTSKTSNRNESPWSRARSTLPPFRSSQLRGPYPKPPTGVKQIDGPSMDVRRSKGLCYRCDEQWAPGHRCQNKSLSRLIIDFDDESEEEDAISSDEEVPEGQHVEVSLKSVSGLTPTKAMKLKGRIGTRDVVVLVDSGASHNFISKQLVNEEKLIVRENKGFRVELGTGLIKQGQGSCPEVKLELPGYTLQTDFLPLDISQGTDAILGMQWLESLGNIKTNWKELRMEFLVDGKKVKLRGDACLSKMEITLRALVRGREQTAECYLVQVRTKEENLEGDATLFGLATEAHTPTMIQGVLREFSDVFKEPEGLPPDRGHEHSILLKNGTTSVSVRPYRYAQIQKNEIEKLVNEMLAAGVIRPSTSPFSSPVLLVKKKDGSWRFCIDYRALNKETIADKFPIPVIDELLDELHGATIFSKIDLKSGYHQIRMAKGDEPKTAFRTHEGQYEFLVMPFGLMNAPATFQSLMNQVFRPWLRKFVLVFFDDILVYSRSLEEHVMHLRQVLGELRKHKLVANSKKSSFGRNTIEYLGHIVSKEGVSADQLKIQAMIEWPEPKTIKELRGFLGLTGYYRKFVQNYGKIAWPLTEQLKKDSFNWNQEATEAFNKLKEAMISVPVLALPDFKEPFLIETDASGYGLGAILMQNKRPIAYFSQALSAQARQKSVYEKELMAIALSVTKWRPYLLGRHFIVRTDQKALKFLLEQKLVAEEHQKWLTKLLGYNFEIHYKPGKENQAADALSRKMPEKEPKDPATFKAISIPQVLDWEALDAENQSASLETERKLAEEGDEDYTLKGTRLFYKGRFMLPTGSPQIPVLLQEFHGSNIGGHSGILITYARLRREFYWAGMKKSVKDFVASCDPCQRNKYSTQAPGGLLQPLKIPTTVWSDISMDFIEGLPKANGFTVIFVVVDRLSKYAHFIPLSHPYTAKTVAQAFIQEIVRLHGIPESIVSDRDTIFTSHLWTKLFEALGTKLKRSTAYHPQSDGQTEVVNRSIGTYLRCFAAHRPREWIKYLPWAEYWYNTSYHTATQITPYEVLYGREPPRLVPYEKGASPLQFVEEELTDRDDVIRDLAKQLVRAQKTMKTNADKHRTDVNFEVGEYVWVKLQVRKQASIVGKQERKMVPKYFGPYRITRKIGAVAYRLELPDAAQIHPVFHVSQLKKHQGEVRPNEVQQLKWFYEYKPRYTPKELIGLREGSEGTEVLILWHHLPIEEATW